MEAREIKWNDFKLNVELHRQYLDVAIKLNLFHYAITGAILSFYFTRADVPMLKYALLLPIILTLSLAGFFFWAAVLAKNMREHIKATAAELGLNAYPEGLVLVVVCAISAVMLSVLFTGMLWLFLTV
jgi:hypothetical protein